MIFTGLSGVQYGVAGKEFRKGGEGAIYDLEGRPDLVAKVFESNKRTGDREMKLRTMLSLPLKRDDFAWPVDVIYQDGNFMGYVMPKVTGKKELLEVVPFGVRENRSWGYFVRVACNLARAVKNVHAMHQVIGDLSLENVLVDPRNAMVTIVDTDSFSITAPDGRWFKCEMARGPYVPKELQGKYFPALPQSESFSENSDRFSLAVIIFQILMNGVHPFACTRVGGSASQFQPIRNIEEGRCVHFLGSEQRRMLQPPIFCPSISSLSPTLIRLFQRVFVDGHSCPEARPSAGEWADALESLEMQLRKCDRGHQYYKNAATCPWCELERRSRVQNEELRQKEWKEYIPPRNDFIPSQQPPSPPSPSQSPAGNVQSQYSLKNSGTHEWDWKESLGVYFFTIVPLMMFTNYKYALDLNEAIGDLGGFNIVSGISLGWGLAIGFAVAVVFFLITKGKIEEDGIPPCFWLYILGAILGAISIAAIGLIVAFLILFIVCGIGAGLASLGS